MNVRFQQFLWFILLSSKIQTVGSPHQVDMKNDAKCWKDFLSYFTSLETYRAVQRHYLFINPTVIHFYGKEYEIWAGYGLVGSTEIFGLFHKVCYF